MQYSPRHRAFHAGTLAAFCAAGVVLLALVLRVFSPAGFFFLASPLFAFGNYVASYGEGVSEEETMLREENAALILQNEVLRARVMELGSKDALDRSTGIVAPVLARPPVSPYDTLILSNGSEKGIEKGAPVLSRGVLIGKIEEAGEGYSRAALFSLFGMQSEGWVGEDRHPITIRGEGGGTFSAQVPREMPVYEGDVVYLPGTSALPIGKVKKIESDTSAPSITLRIQSLANILSITEVRIIERLDSTSP